MGQQELKAPVELQDVLNSYYLHWNTKGTLPSVAEIARQYDCNPVTIQNLVNDDKFRRSLVIRGVPLSQKSVLTPEQFKCIAIVTDPTRRGGLKARLKEAGISYATYNSWMVNPEFRSAVNSLAERILENSLADVNTGLVEAASKGDVGAVKFFYEVTGRYNPADRQVMDVMSVLAQVVEIIQRHVTDPEILESMATDIRMLTAVAGAGTGKVIQG